MKGFFSKQNIYFICTILIVISFAFISLSLATEDFISSFCNNVGSVLLISGVFGIINESLLKFNLSKYIISNLNINNKVIDVGIYDVLTNKQDINYKELLLKSKKTIDIVVVYDRTLIATQVDNIRLILEKKKINIRVFLLDPESEFAHGFELYYNKKNKMKYGINETKNNFIQAYESVSNPKGKLEIYYYRAHPACSLYRFDETMVVVNGTFYKKPTKIVPIYIIENNTNKNNLFELYIGQINDLIDKSQKIY